MRHVTVVLEIVLREHFDDLGQGTVAHDVLLQTNKKGSMYVVR